MVEKNTYKCPEIQEILNALNSESEWSDIVIRLQHSTPENDEIKGVKSFLEKNNYAAEKLEKFLQDGLMSIEEKNIELKKNTVKSFSYKVAAIIIVLVTVSTFLFYNSTTQGEKLYAKYYEKELGLPVTMNINQGKKFNESMNLFRNEQYHEAMEGFQALNSTQMNNDTLYYFIGVCQMELNELDSALDEFSQVGDHSVFKEKVEYRMALIYFKKENFDMAKSVLNNIVLNKKHAYLEKAKMILEEPVFN